MKRRQSIKYLSAASIAALAPVTWSCNTPDEKLNVLVLGGTYFVGPSIVNALMDAGHQVTLFNRGITNPDLFPDLRLIKGDRELGKGSYLELQKEDWDVVIDVWPEKSQLVDEATSALKDSTKHYVFISSIAVYNDFQEVGLHENSEVVSLPEDQSNWYYSEEKLAAEHFVTERFPDNHTILRPGPIKGWRDPALDLLYWLIKLRDVDPVLAPGSGMDPLQYIDVKDVGRFVELAITKNLFGIYNVVGPGSSVVTWREYLIEASSHLQFNSNLHWAPEIFLKEQGVSSFTDLPLWAPLSEDRGFMQISNDKLMDTGFKLSPISATIDDCLEWYDNHMTGPTTFGTSETGLGLSPDRELELIALLKTN